MSASPDRPTCEERYYPQWSSRGMRGVDCTRPAKFEAWVNPYSDPYWKRLCGVHVKAYSVTRPLA